MRNKFVMLLDRCIVSESIVCNSCRYPGKRWWETSRCLEVPRVPAQWFCRRG